MEETKKTTIDIIQFSNWGAIYANGQHIVDYTADKPTWREENLLKKNFPGIKRMVHDFTKYSYKNYHWNWSMNLQGALKEIDKALKSIKL